MLIQKECIWKRFLPLFTKFTVKEIVEKKLNPPFKLLLIIDKIYIHKMFIISMYEPLIFPYVKIYLQYFSINLLYIK